MAQAKYYSALIAMDIHVDLTATCSFKFALHVHCFLVL